MLRKVDGLKPIADELGVPLSQLAIAWCAANPNVSSVICGATKESQVSFHFSHVQHIFIANNHVYLCHIFFSMLIHYTFSKKYLKQLENL